MEEMKCYFAGKKDEISGYLDEFEAGHREDRPTVSDPPSAEVGLPPS